MRPNVVLVTTDDQGYGDLGCHGNPIIRTPHLDALHGESVRFENFHVCPTCAPTRSALMTGHYSLRTGIWHTITGRSIMNADETTMGEVFADNGYRTGIFGKWHLGDNYPYRPQDRGFQETLVHGGGGVGQAPDYWGNDYFDDTYFHNGEPEKYQGYCTDIWFENALNFIEANRNRPFFCYIPTNAPHSPYNVPDNYRKMYEGKENVVNPAFYGMITNVDDNVGRLIARLRELGLEENTILIFLTDNGSAAGVATDREQFPVKGYNAGMRGKKGSQYDGGHRVPCFMRWPGGGLGGGRTIDTLAAHMDILPTLIDLCALDPPEGVKFDGRSLVSLFRDQATDWPDRAIMVDTQRVEIPEKWRNSAVMTQRWRLINGAALYDMAADPGQTTNVAKDHPEEVERLRGEYEKWWASVSERFDDFSYIPLGPDPVDEVRLLCHDWHGDVPWNQETIRKGKKANGWWAVEVVHTGEYEFELRRWPKEADLAITAAPKDGAALNITRAKMTLQDAAVAADVPKNTLGVTFRVPLEAGTAKLQTWFIEEDGTERGAYYVYVRRVK
ncbi:MAG: arylsulfatase [Candidatus Hydrogenedentes bacterium]|nr:arylsulfatase [Candidatus Hydrogenedentota bacterium]